MSTFIHQIENILNQPNLLFQDWQAIGRILLSGILIYFLLILIINFYGKRSISNLSMHDYVVTIAMGSIAGSTIILDNVTLLDGLIGILILLSLQFIVTFLSRYDTRIFRKLNSAPSVLFLKGEFIEENMKENRITQDEIYSAIRSQGQCTSDQIYAVVIESNGDLSVIQSASKEYEKEITRFL